MEFSALSVLVAPSLVILRARVMHALRLNTVTTDFNASIVRQDQAQSLDSPVAKAARLVGTVTLVLTAKTVTQAIRSTRMGQIAPFVPDLGNLVTQEKHACLVASADDQWRIVQAACSAMQVHIVATA